MYGLTECLAYYEVYCLLACTREISNLVSLTLLCLSMIATIIILCIQEHDTAANYLSLINGAILDKVIQFKSESKDLAQKFC